jgi:hypothetical protein
MPAPKPSKQRQAQLAAGLARIEAGESIERAARRVRVPASTLYDWHRRSYAGDPEAVKKLEEIVLAQACEIATTAGAVLAERVPRLDDGKLIAAWGTAVDKIALRQGWSRGVETAQATGAGDAVARILQALDGKSLTISVSAEDYAEQALDVSPKAGG